MAKLMRYSGKVEEVTPINGDHFILEELQNYVGGYIEVVDCFTYEPDEVNKLIVNEEGCLMCLPENKLASEKAGVVLVGNVVQLTKDEWMKSLGK